MSDVKASSPPQLPPPTVKTRVRLNGSEERARRTHVTRSIVYSNYSKLFEIINAKTWSLVK